MPKYADYIKRIEIDSLWSGKKHIVWELNRQVNILSGTNGQGKSTILNKVVKGLIAGGEFPRTCSRVFTWMWYPRMPSGFVTT